MDNKLAVINDFDTMQRQSMALYKSGYFNDVKSEAQAIVKVMAGAELGLPPFASMSGIHIIQGKPVLGANVIAALVKNDPRYNYRIIKCDDTECIIEWLENGQKVGSAGFSMKEAQAAGLTGKDNWKRYPSDMLFARAISRGARRFAPGIFGGAPVYTPDEMNLDTDEDGYIEGEVVTEPESVKVTRLTAEEMDKDVVTILENSNGPEPDPEPLMPTDKQRRQFHAVGTKAYGDEWDDRRPALVKAITKGRATSSNELTADEMGKLIIGMNEKIEATRKDALEALA